MKLPILEILKARYPQTQYALGEEFLYRELVLKVQEQGQNEKPLPNGEAEATGQGPRRKVGPTG